MRLLLGRSTPWLGLIPFLVLIPAAAETQQHAQQLPVLTRVAQLRNLSRSAAERGYPVHIRAIVTYFDPQEPDLFVQDSSAGIWVDLGKKNKLSLKAGQLLEIKGVSSAPDFAPQIAKPQITVLGEANLPRALPVSFERMASAAEDSQWVEMEGIVHSADVDRHHLVLAVVTDGGRVTVLIPWFGGAAPSRLVDSKVRLRGACGSVFNQKNQLTGIRLFVPSLAQVETEEKAPVNPFQCPVQPIESLLRFTPKGASGHRVRVQGVVTFRRSAKSFLIQDATQGLYAQTSQETAIELGDRVDVVGFPTLAGYATTLTDAMVRKLGAGADPNPATVTGEQVMQGAYDGEVIRIQARLQGQLRGRAGTQLILQSGSVIFDTEASDSQAVTHWPRLNAGSLLQLTGVCSMKVDEDRMPRAFRVLLRSPKDVAVLEEGSWWTLGRAAWGLGIMGIVILAALGWVLVLRHQVTEQTGIILRRLQREVALEERYRDLFENASDIVYTHDLKGNITSFNRAGERGTGYSRDEAMKMNMDHLVAPGYREIAHQMTEQTISTGGTATYELEVITKDGRRVPLEVSTRLMHENGKPFGVQGNARNIAERKRIQAEVTAAKEAAEAASRAKSEFLANVSHEIRTPMNGILGMTELALETLLTPEQREYLEIVKASGASLLQVINDILDLSKVEAGKLELEAIPFSLQSKLESILQMLAPLAHKKGLELACHISADVPQAVIGDPERLGQIVTNLASNAIKFTQQGGVRIRVDTESRITDKVCLHFSVTDTGIGIAADKQHLIFEAFAQADGSTTRKHGGTGLGLAICAQLVEPMHGRIWVESAPGNGSTFHFTASFGLEKAAATRPARPAETVDVPGDGREPRDTTISVGNGALDRAAALARVEGDAALLAELAELFIDDYPRMVLSIHEALAREDPEALARAAHAIKGSLGDFAARKASDAALKLERIGLRGNLSHAPEAMAALEEELRQLGQALAGLTKEVAPP